MRRFELSDGKSNKFWEIDEDGSDLHLRWGRIGTSGQSKTKSFESAEAAAREAEKQIRSKVKKGYEEVEAEEGTTRPATPAAAGDAGNSKAEASASPRDERAGEATAPDAVVPSTEPSSSEASAAEGPSADLPDEDSPAWTDKLLRRVEPRHDRPWPIGKPPKASLRTSYRKIHEGWRPPPGLRRYLPEDLRPHFGSYLDAFEGDLPKETPVPEDPRQASVLLLGLRLRLPENSGEKLDPLSRQVVDYWVASGGLVFAATAACETLLADIDAFESLKRPWRGNAQSLVRWGAGGFDRLRQHLAAAEDDEHAAALAVAEDAWPRLDFLQRVVLSYLFPERRDWIREIAAVGRHEMIAEQFLFMAVGDGEELAESVDDRFVKNFVGEYRHVDVMPTLVYSLGAGAAPHVAMWLEAARAESWRDRKAVRELAEVLAPLPSDEAMAALLAGLEDSDVDESMLHALQSFPRRGLRHLAPEVGARGARGRRAKALALSILHRHEGILEHLPPEVREQLASLGGDDAPEAPLCDLPPVLTDPPWLRRQKKKAPKTLALVIVDEPHRIDWSEGQQERWLRRRPESEWYGHYSRAAHRIRSAQGQDVARMLRKVNGYERDEVVAWLPSLLARHGLAVVDFVLELPGTLAATALKALTPVDSVRLTPVVAEWFMRLKSARAGARRWLLGHPRAAALGLLPATVGKKGKPRDAAIEALRLLAGSGHRSSVEEAIETYQDQVDGGAETLRSALAPVLDYDPLDVLPSKLPDLPTFADPLMLPRPALRDGRQLPLEAVEPLLVMLAFSPPDMPYAGLEQVREALDPGSLAAFAYGVFEAWLANGADSKEKWAFYALGHFGGDAEARRLEPQLRAWPREGGHARAVLGLEILTMIGSDMALMLLHGIALKARNKGIQKAAGEAVDLIAEERGLTIDELADRLVPELDLDPDGSRLLDYGPRSFRVGFDELLVPFVVDEDGKKRKAAPKPGARDDAAKAKAAFDAWKQLKKDVKTVAKQQRQRLELAMCTGRRWSAADFRTLLAAHPLLGHLVRRLLWGVFDEKLVEAFRVDADGSFADAEDEPWQLPEDARVGLVHRLELTGEEADLWRGQWRDYELVAPFPQLERDVYRPEPGELKATKLERCMEVEVPAGRVMGLERWGWSRGEVQDAGLYYTMNRPFGDGSHEVQLYFEPGIAIGDPSAMDSPVLKELVIQKAGAWRQPSIPFGELPEVVFSEVVRDLVELTRPR